MLHEIRYAIRSFRRSGAFATVTTLTLSLGIGAVTALFAVVRAVLLNPIVPEQDQVVRVSKLDTRRGDFPLSMSLHEIAAWREESRSFEAVAAVDHAATGSVAIAVDRQPFAVELAPVSANFFRVVRAGEPLYGRWFTTDDEQRGAEPVAVISERLWRRAFGSDPALVGRTLSWAGNRTLRVVGIASAAVDYPLGTDIWAPGTAVFDGRAGRFDASSRGFSQFELVGRLAPGVSIDRARAELTAIDRRLAEQFPDDYRAVPILIEPLVDAVVGDSRRVLVALLGAAGLVFVIAGVNVAALLLMRASSRRREVAIRAALGAGYGRMLRQTLAEGLVLGGAAAAGALFFARALLGVAQWLAPGDIPRIEQAAVDLRVLSFSVVAALVWVLVLGTVPMWTHRRAVRAARVELGFRGVRGTTGLLVFTAAEIAAAVVVAIGAGLLLRTVARLQAVDRGFASNDTMMATLLLPEGLQHEPRALLAFYNQLTTLLEALPGVVAAAPIHFGPGSGTLGLSAPMLFDGQTPEAARTNVWSTWEPVTPSYFRTLGIPIVRGRAFTADDRRGGRPVAIVSESVASRYWPGQNPLGKQLKLVAASEWPWVTVVGVSADTRYRELTKTWMTVYFPADQFFFFQATSLVIRATSARATLAPAILERVHALEPGAAIASIAPLDTLLARELSRPRTALTVTGIFALMAVVLAAVGVYGVLSYDVRQRRGELAVRAAIGASPTQIFRSVLRRSLAVGVAGAAIGVGAAAMVTRLLRSLLFEVQPLDMAVFLSGSATLLVVVLIAASFPARRAAGADPATVLRAE